MILMCNIHKSRGQTVGGITYWDCSSFVKHCYEVAGLSIVDITGPQYNQVAKDGKFISQSEAQPGDLYFGVKADRHHIAVYAGNEYVMLQEEEMEKSLKIKLHIMSLYGTPEFGRHKCSYRCR